MLNKRTVSVGSILSIAVGLMGCQRSLDRQGINQRTLSLFGPSTGDERMQESEDPLSEEAILSSAEISLYQRYGLLKNVGLRSVFNQWKASIERVPQVSNLPDPIFSFTQFVEEVQTRTGAQERRYRIAQSFPWFGKLTLRGDIAESAAAESWEKVEGKRLEVERDIAIAFYEYGYLVQSIRITEEVLDLLRRLEPVVQRRIQGGSAGQEDLLRLQVEIGKIENEATSLQEIKPALNSRLAAAMNWTHESPLPFPILTEPISESIETHALLEKAKANNPRVRELAEGVNTASKGVDLSNLDKWPDLTFGLDYIETSQSRTQTRGSGNDPLSLQLMLNLPIWRSKYAASEREAKYRLDAAKGALADFCIRLQPDIEVAAFELGDSGRQVRLYRDALLPRAREALEVTRTSYRGGNASLLDLIDSERILLQFETAYWRACRDFFQGQARLQALVGGDIQ